MKAGAFYVAIFVLALLIIPMVAISFERESVPVHTPAVPQGEGEHSTDPPAPVENTREPGAGETQEEAEPGERALWDYGVSSFLILNESTGIMEQVPVRDYVRGAVAAEMPVSFHTEALKAQAVAAHTYALHHHYTQAENPDPALKGADFAADPQNRLGYLTEADALAWYGDNADLYWGKITDAVDSVLDTVMLYEEEPIVAAYHAISAGRTEYASNIWNGAAPYLVPVDSEGDYLAPDFETVESFSVGYVRDTLEAAYPEINLPDEPEEWFSDILWSESGYVTQVEVGGVTLHGKDLRTLFDLRSHSMDISYTDSGFTFIVYGYGHGVGLSQYGADYLARQGLDYKEILETYYTGVDLVQIALEE